MAEKTKFRVGNYVTFDGRVGNFTTEKKPETIVGKITSIEQEAMNIDILNDPEMFEPGWCFAGCTGYCFPKKYSSTIKKITKSKALKMMQEV